MLVAADRVVKDVYEATKSPNTKVPSAIRLAEAVLVSAAVPTSSLGMRFAAEFSKLPLRTPNPQKFALIVSAVQRSVQEIVPWFYTYVRRNMKTIK